MLRRVLANQFRLVLLVVIFRALMSSVGRLWCNVVLTAIVTIWWIRRNRRRILRSCSGRDPFLVKLVIVLLCRGNCLIWILLLCNRRKISLSRLKFGRINLAYRVVSRNNGRVSAASRTYDFYLLRNFDTLMVKIVSTTGVLWGPGSGSAKISSVDGRYAIVIACNL